MQPKGSMSSCFNKYIEQSGRLIWISREDRNQAGLP